MKKAIIASVISGIIILVLSKMFSKKGKSKSSKMKIIWPFKTKYSGDIEKDVTSYILEKEGGIVTDKDDKASDSPLKFDWTVNGKFREGIHTNKGITVDTFFKYAPIVKIPATQAQFIKMPDDNVFKIFKEIYYKPFAKTSQYPVFNYMFALWAWGSGVGTSKSLIKGFLDSTKQPSIDSAIDKYGRAETFRLLVEYRIDFYNRLASKDAKRYGKFKDGWINSASNFFEIFKRYAD